MKLLVPASSKQLTDRALWFKKPIARKLAQKKNVEFGFELKGSPKTIVEAPPLYWGYHIPGNFASEWYYHPELRAKMLNSLSHISSLQPSYLNLHGIHLWWQPPKNVHQHRYLNHSKPAEIFKVLESTIELIEELKKSFDKITLENYPLFQLYQKNGRCLPETYLYTGTGRLNDLLYIKKETDIEIMLDLEHLILTLNFLNREKNYRDIPINRIEKLRDDDKKINQIFGFYLPEGGYPYLENNIEISNVIKNIAAKHYHITGSDQDVLPGVRDLTHGPIKKENQTFRKNLRVVLTQKPVSMLIETANSLNDPDFTHLRPNETELSFYELCEILIEEL